ncbi:MAG: hypothetical protein CMI02_10210 [Oceanospirillaceae bacterium]|nr:hypothetical protein [Oceanospirillaceae bacterium]MBT12396.1 hypothetical protein [Oceanospirillaceae bacterium]|tara:strand:- start:13088 stop:13837 length:750 start_codon:yes stop_codon:yes gene_type:complete
MKLPLIITALLVTATAFADELTDSQAAIKRTDNAGQQSQAKIEKLDDKALSLQAEFRQLKAEKEQLALYNRQMESIVDSQNQELASLDRQIAEIEQTERGVLPLMSRMVDSLEQFVRLDTPFLPQERSARVALLKDLLTRADVTVSEKFRRVLEAYQVEVDYGRNIEAYRGQENNISYDFLRIGRLALYRISNDGEQAWLWHKGKGEWLALDSGYLRDLRQALKVAQQTSAPELLVVPMATPASLGGDS